MKEKLRDYIASELRALRGKNNISLEELSTKCGINKDTICRYENANVSISIDNLEKILDCYDSDFVIFFNNYCANKHN